MRTEFQLAAGVYPIDLGLQVGNTVATAVSSLQPAVGHHHHQLATKGIGL